MWKIPKIWDGDSYIVGGGKSLSTFPFEKLKGKRVIGCNDSYLLGDTICDFICFGDLGWYNIHQKGLLKYTKPIIASVSPRKLQIINKNVKFCERTTARLSQRRDTLGWFSNTGIMGIELAMKLGSKRIYLLGFDMQLTDGIANWYSNLKDKPNSAVYDKFLRNFKGFDLQKQSYFPDIEIINLNPNSGLELYEKKDWSEVL